MARVGASDNLQPKSSFDIQMTQSTKGNNNENSSGGEGGSCESSSGDNSSSNGIKLKKEISLLDGVAIIVGVIVGSGIFVSPKGVLIHSGSILQSIIVWILSGILSLVGALCYAELGTMIPKSGGDYAYIDVAFGPLPAFLYLWVALLILIPTGNAITALTFAQYLLQPFWPSCEAPVEAVQLLAAVITCFLTMVNCYNVKWVTRITDIFTGTKILALLIIVGAGAYYLFTGNTEKWDYPLEGSQLSPGFIALAFYNGLFSYSGWNYLNYVTEELKDPYKNLPRAICISLPLVTTIYVVTNIAYFSVLTPDEILSSEAVAVTFGDKMLGFMAWLMPFFVACSTFGALNGAIFGASRLLFVGARNGHLPAAISLINVKFLTPIPSLLFLGVVTLILLFIRDMYALINYVQFVEAFFTFMSISGLLWLRKKNPDSNRPIKVNLSLPILYLIICGFLMISSIYVSPMEVGIGSAIIVSGIPIYYLTIYRPVEVLTSMSQKLNIWCSKFFLCMPNQEKID